MGRIGRKEDSFYALFRKFSKDLLACSEAYADVVCRWPESAQRIAEVQEREDTCDRYTDTAIELLAKSFIVPFDRADINAIVFAMDDAVDLMEDVATRFELFGVEESLPEAKEMATLTVRAASKLSVMFEHLPDAKVDDTAREEIREIRKIEDECDAICRNGLAEIFAADYEAAVLLRWKSLLDSMGKVMGAISLVAFNVRTVLIKTT